MNLPPGKYLAKHQPCGCIICTCEDEMRCHGCGAKHCGTHSLGQLPDPIFEDRPEEATPETDAATHDDWSGGTPAVEVETCKRLERERNHYKAKAEALLASADAISAAARDLRKFKKFPESVEALAGKIILELHPFQA